MRPDGLVHSDGPAILAGNDAPSLQVPDGFDIFSAQYSRDGDDLVIATDGSPPLTVIDYFTVDSPPALAMPNGTMLTGDVVDLLAGPRAPGQYAQADAPEGADAIGQVETLSGSSTATRESGETVELAQGDPVFQGDVIETAGDSTLGIRLEDGTLASMSSQSRLVLNEFVFEAGGSDNWMLVNLVEGAFAFLTGAIAPSGGMEITTPVAVMAIRGTMPVAFISGVDGATEFFAASDQDYELLHLTTREILAVVSSEAGFSLSSPDAPLEAIELDPATLDEIDGLLDVLNDAAAELGLLGIQDDSGFHTYSAFGSIGTAQLIQFLLLLDNALAEEAVLEVADPDQFLMAEAVLTASPDQSTTDEMHPVIIDVLDNDNHPDNLDLTVVFADVPNGQGSVTIMDGQFLVFDPGTDFDYLALGETTDVVITYVVSDSTGAIASSTATVTLTGINQAPVIASVGDTSLDEQTNTQPLTATIPVTFSDVDLNNVGHAATVVDVTVSGENGGLSLNKAALIALVSPGTVIKNAGDANGSVDIDFTAGSGVFDYLAHGEVVTLTYTLEIDDGDGGTTLRTFDVTITGTNDAPVVNEPLSDVVATVVEDGFNAGGNPVGDPDASGQIAASDVDNGGRTFSVAATEGKFGVFAISASGAWTYTLDDAAADHLSLGQTRTEVFEVTVTDGFGATDKVLVTITVQGTNEAPQVSNVSLAATEDGAVVTGGFVGDDRDSDDNSGSLTYNVTQPAEGSVVNNGDGTFGFDPGNDFQDLGAGDTRTVTFTYTATDSHGLVSPPATVTVTVTGTNDVPVVSGVSTGAVMEDAHPTTLTTGGALAIADPDAGESSFASQTNVAGTYGSFTLLADGTWTYIADNKLPAIQGLGAGDTLTDSFTAVSSDGTATQKITVTIHGDNDVGLVTGGGTLNYTENDAPTVIDSSITVADADNTDLTGATVSITGNFVANEDVLGFTSQNGITGSYNAATGVLTLTGVATLAQYQAALASVTYFNSSDDPSGADRTISFQVNDGDDLSNVATSTVTVAPVNDAPVVTGGVTLDYTEDDDATVIDASITIADVDSTTLTSATVSISSGYVNGQDVLGFTSQNGITGSWDSATGKLTLTGIATLAQYQAALASVTYVNTSDDPSGANRTISFQVNDGEDVSNIATSTVTVDPTNDDPVISVVGNNSDEAVLTADEATPTSFVLSADQGDPGYTAGKTATVTFYITRGDGSEEVITIEDLLMGPSHQETLSELVNRINSEDNGLDAVYKSTGTNAWQFTLFVDGGALAAEDLRVEFDNPHSDRPNSFDFGVELLQPGTDAEGLSASGTLSVVDVDAGDEVDAFVAGLTIDGTGEGSLPSGLNTSALLAMMSIDFNPVIVSGGTTGQIAWTFDSQDEAFGFLDPNDSLILIYTIAATDSAGAVTEHEVTITINGAGSDSQLLASSSALEFSSALMASTGTLDDDSGGEVFVLTETDVSIDEVIIDYREGDVIDLTRLGFELETGQLNADAAAEYVDYDQVNGVLSVDVDGADGSADFEVAAEFVAPPPSLLVRLSDGDSTADIEIA